LESKGSQCVARSRRGSGVTVYLGATTSVGDLKLLVNDAFSYWCMRPYATSVCGVKLLVYEA